MNEDRIVTKIFKNKLGLIEIYSILINEGYIYKETMSSTALYYRTDEELKQYYNHVFSGFKPMEFEEFRNVIRNLVRY